MEMEESPRKPKRTVFMVISGRKRLAVIFIILMLCVIGLLSYLTYKVESLSTPQSKADGDSTLDDNNGDPDEGPGIMAKMTDYQKFFFNIGIMQKDVKDCYGTEAKVSFPNIDYAFFGYDIYRGFPLTDSRDPGFTHPIFKADYSLKHQSADCRYALPNGYVAVSSMSCVTSFQSSVIQTMKQLDNSLSMMATFSLGYKGFAFSSSSGYSKITSSISNLKSVYIVSSAYCDYYFVKLRDKMPPSFDDDFLIWLSKLDTSDSNTTYVQFMDRYGTHFLSEATFGARFTNEYEMDSTDFKDFVENKISVGASASFAGKVSIGAGYSLETSQRNLVEKFSEKVKIRTITVGASPPSNGEALTWASEVKENPVPSRFVLKPIEDLFVPEYFGSLGIDYETIRLYLMQYREDYKRYREQNKQEIVIEPNNILGLWRVKRTLFVTGGGIQGEWGHIDFCPDRQYAIGYNLKIEPHQGKGDDTALNGIELICADRSGRITGDKIKSWVMKWGNWRDEQRCTNAGSVPTFLTRFSLQMYDYVHVAATYAKFKCQDVQKTVDEYDLAIFPGYNDHWGGYWVTSESCPTGSAICGMRTKVEDDRDSGDDSALNNVKFYCCALDIIE